MSIGVLHERIRRHRESLRRSPEGSLKRLGADSIDLYQVHLWDHATPVPEVMSALDDVVRSGEALHAAISDAPAWIVALANTSMVSPHEAARR